MKDKLRKALQTNIPRAAFLTFVSALLLAGALTLAWYTRDPKTESQTTEIKSETSSAALFIAAGSTPDGAQLAAAAVDTTSYLFPISTADCVHWYYADNVDVSTGRVSQYAQAQITEANLATGLYYNADEETSKYAYHRADFVFYTNGGSFSVYLDPDEPISVSGDGARGYLDDAVRIAVVEHTADGDVLKFIYAPVAESGTGNSYGASANTFYAVTGPTTLSTASVLTTLSGSPYLADTSVTPVQGGSDTICVAGDGSEGNPYGSISVYMWLEGTDAQTKLGRTDNEFSDGVRVTLKFIGLGG